MPQKTAVVIAKLSFFYAACRQGSNFFFKSTKIVTWILMEKVTFLHNQNFEVFREEDVCKSSNSPKKMSSYHV